MTIGIDASRANLKHRTGTEWYSFYLIKNLAEIDKKNKYVLYVDKEPSLDLKKAVSNNSNFKFKLLKWPFSSFWTLGRLSLEMIFKKPDVLFVPAHALPFCSPKKTVNTIHDLAFLRDSHLYRLEKYKSKRGINKLFVNSFVKLITLGKYRASSLDYLYWSANFALKKASDIITVSHFSKKEILNFFPKANPDKITVVHNGYNSDLYRKIEDREAIDTVLFKYGIERPFFLYVGRLEKKKNTPLLIEAMSILKENCKEIEKKLLLIGNASFGFDEVKYVMEEFNLERDIIIPGWVEEEDMPYVFNAASAFVFPSKYEGFGIPVLQSMACGVPTIVSDIPVLKEVAGNAALYFDQNNPFAMAESMRQVIEDSSLRDELIENGYKRVKEFDFRKCAKETLVVLEGKK
ncbi:MAG: glycosyltransferase family 1 protein [Patescibacteria group bacterium]|jgi:glycosyltransferase involved in cell wall biosynthesis|nr:glycosyltransferase family 1 protein [Patescibacteria group bacterium]